MARKKKKIISTKNNPRITICTPTYNRRDFIPGLIKCVDSQTYPKELIEWLIVDDGSDPVGDLFEGIDYVRYIRLHKKMKLGQKRNLLNKEASGEIIVYMDDDDFYPPDRIIHAVNKLRISPALIAGSSAMHVYFKDIDQIYKLGPYNKYHATAGTFAFKKELLNITSYEDSAEFAEERYFLKDYTIPLVQLEPKSTILVFSHKKNTYDKKNLIGGPNVYETKLSPEAFIKDNELLSFYLDKC
ncbi:glycosyltransferase family A protein [Neptuniibacter sp.]|uniref:glycosyltransferase family 2 protein n=1 Tax=Neptuniibacter sp. TaxID=1962643 RepID=UPI0026365B81|nr:glycosyltransferase family A protein [Neptuniibacter sp.]MCP4598776.1 glycosyltransferase family 2 protein [Neptuniibacter sp.]